VNKIFCELKLEKQIELTCFTTIATLAYHTRQEAYQNILRKALDKPINKNIIKEIIRKELNKEDALLTKIAEAILENFKKLNYIKESGNLTKSGKNVADTGYIKILETGKFLFWYISDEFLGEIIVHFERDPSVIVSDINENSELRNIEEIEFKSLITNLNFKINKFETPDPKIVKIANIKRNNSKLKLLVDMKFEDINYKEDYNTNYSIEGNLINNNNEKKINYKDVKNFSVDDIIRKIESILNGIIKLYSEEKNLFVLDKKYLAFKINKISFLKEKFPETIENYTITASIDDIEIEGWGKFDKCILSNFLVIPSNESIIKDWIITQIENKLNNNYLTIYDVNKIKNNFYKYYRDKDISLPEIELDITEDIIDKLLNENKMEEYWHLQSCIDLEISN